LRAVPSQNPIGPQRPESAGDTGHRFRPEPGTNLPGWSPSQQFWGISRVGFGDHRISSRPVHRLDRRSRAQSTPRRGSTGYAARRPSADAARAQVVQTQRLTLVK